MRLTVSSNIPWIRRPIREKRAHAIGHARPFRCLVCETQVMPEAYPEHRARCPGRRELEKRDRWIAEGEVERFGVSLRDVRRATRRGIIRARELEGVREYLARDLALYADARRVLCS